MALKLLFVLVAFMAALPLMLTASAATQPYTVLVFASDYESDDTATAATSLSNILDQIYATGDTVSQAVFCGDYTNSGTTNYGTDATTAISAIKSAVSSSLGSSVSTSFVQGGSDTWNASLMASEGAHEYSNYILYVINPQGYNPVNQGSTYSTSKTYVSNTATALNTYLQSLVSSGDKRPVFIVSYMPLHMTSATSALYTGDNMFSYDLFNVINNAAVNLDIFYLYGHNHSHGFDSYLGGSCAYLAKGAAINIPDYNVGATATSTNKFNAYTLNFTYMNTGYIGNIAGSTADSAATASVFKIYNDRVTVSRYDGSGLHQLGAAGAYNTTSDNGAYNDSNGFVYSGTTYKYTPTATATASPQIITRRNASTVAMTLSGTAATATVGTAATLTAAVTNATPTVYTWTTTDNTVAKVTGNTASAAVEYNKAGTATVTCTATYDAGNGTQNVSQNYTVTVSASTSYHTEYTYTLASWPTITGDSATYVVSTTAGQALTYNGSLSSTAGTISGSSWTPPTGLTNTDTVLWTITKYSSSYYRVQTNYNDNYLKITSSLSCTSGTTNANLTLTSSGTGYRFYGSRYLRYNSGFTTTTSSTSATAMNLYQVGTVSVQDDPTLSIVNGSGTAPSGTFTGGDSLKLYAATTNIAQITGYSWSSSDTSVMTVTNPTAASPTVNFVGHGAATISLTVTYNDGSTKTINATTASLSVQSPKTYQRITSLSDIVSGQNYLIIWPKGDSSSSLYHLVSRTATTSGSNVGLTPTSLSSIVGSNTVGSTFSADCTDYEWQFTQSGSTWKVGIPGSASGYMTLASNSLTLGSTGSNCTITVSSTGDTTPSGGYGEGPYFQITAANNYSLDRFSTDLFSGYSGGENRYCFLYKIVTNTTTPVDATADIAQNGTVISGTTQNRYSVSSGQTETLTAQYSHLTNATVSWSSSNTAAAVINASGVITYKGHSGAVTFTMTVTGTNEYGATQTITKTVTYVVATNAKITTIQILKNDSSGNPLAGAGFNLYSDSNCTTRANVYLDSACTVPLSTAPTTSLLTGSQGLMRYYGVSPGTYYLKEFYAPKGYDLLTGVISITVAADQTVTVANSNGTYSPTVSDGIIKLTLTDQLTVLNMPQAGHGGIFRYFAVGAGLMILAILPILFLLKRKTRPGSP